MATFIGLIMNSKCQQTLYISSLKVKKIDFFSAFICPNGKSYILLQQQIN